MNHQALHLKYRPQILSEIVGQNLICRSLTNAIAHEKIVPAYLFAGVKGTGKTSAARIFAKSLNCLTTTKPTVTPCGKCNSCRTIEKSNSLDVVEIDAASHNGVDDARELIESSSFGAIGSRYRVFLIDECQMLTHAAQNALLKLLEEPPAKVVFILCTTEIHKLLPTIISRCQTFYFRAHSLENIVRHLTAIAKREEINIDPEALQLIARHSGGGIRDALQLLSQLSLLDEKVTTMHITEAVGALSRNELRSLVNAIIAGDTIQVLQIARNLIDSGRDCQLILNSLLQVYRDLLLVSSTNSPSLLTGAIDYRQLKQLIGNLDFSIIEASLQQLQKSEYRLKTSINASIWLEVCLLDLLNLTKSMQAKPIKPKSKNLTQIWLQVLKSVKPTSRELLSLATLDALNSKVAVLKVERRYLHKFKCNHATIERLINNAISGKVKLVVKEKVQ
jgi:DNA polymerase-3 subunit gamma/tau